MTVGLIAYDHCLPAACREDGSGPSDRLVEDAAAEKLSIAAARGVLAKAGVKASEVDLIVASNMGSRFIMPGLGSAIHEGVGAPLEVPAYTVQTGPASFIDACFLAKGMIKGDPDIKTALVVCVTALHTGGWGAGTDDDWPTPLQDAGAAALLSADGAGLELLGYANQTKGEAFEKCVVDIPPTRHGENRAYLKASEEFLPWLESDGADAVRDALKAAVKEAGAQMSDLERIISYKTPVPVLEAWEKAVEGDGVDRSRWYIQRENDGSAFSVDLPLALGELAAAGDLSDGALIAFVASGMGGHSPALVGRWRN